jgi:hypothetical protein
MRNKEVIMATPAEYTVGANAAMPVAVKYIDQLVPSEFRGMIPQSDIQQMVNEIVVAGIDAIDASRAKTP